MLEGVETMIKTLAVENSLTGFDTAGNAVKVDRQTRFSVLLGDYMDVAAGDASSLQMDMPQTAAG